MAWTGLDWPASENESKVKAKSPRPKSSVVTRGKSKGKGCIWTAEEDAVITTLYGKHKKPWKEVVEAINQLPSCEEKRGLDIAKNRWHKCLKHIAMEWSDEEIIALERNYDAITRDPRWSEFGLNLPDWPGPA